MTPVNSRSKFRLAAGLLLLACGQGSPDGLALVGATLIDGTGGPPLQNAAVVVRRGKIESVGSRASFELPGRTTEVDLSGRWIIPGLIDAHAHLGEAATWAPARYLVWGVTTVRDMHGALQPVLTLRRRANSETGFGPRVYAAGAMIDGLPTTYPDAIGVSTEHEARKAVDRLVSAGVDYIKVYTHIDGPMLRAIVDEASTFHVGVAAHLGMTDAIAAAKAGVTSIEHLTGIPEAVSSERSSLIAAHYRGFFPGWTAFERSWARLEPASLRQVAVRLAEEKVTLVPTLVLHETLSRMNDPAALRDSTLKDVPEQPRRDWDIPGMIKRAGWSEADFGAFQRSRSMQDLFVQAFAAAGGRVVTGTDAPNQLLVPGYSEHRELELLVKAGLSPREALRAATRNAATLLGADSLGLLASGKVADLIVLTRDPLGDIRNTRSIEAVMIRGRLLDTDSIRASW